jgi:hypothetical protein
VDVNACLKSIKENQINSLLMDWSKSGKDTVFLLKTSLYFLILKTMDLRLNKLINQKNKQNEQKDFSINQEMVQPVISSSSLKNEFFIAFRNYFFFKLNKNKIKCQNDSKIHKKYLVFEGDPMNFNLIKEEIINQTNVSNDQIKELNKFKIDELKRITRGLIIKEKSED